MRLLTTTAAAVTTVLGAGTALVAAGRYAVDTVLRPAAGAPVPVGLGGWLTVGGADATDRVTLAPASAARYPGVYGLSGPGCHAVVGPRLEPSERGDAVVRQLERVTLGALTPGTRVRLTPQIHQGDPRRALGLDHAEVDVPGAHGPLPAWFVPGWRDTWVLTVHGLGTTREHPMVVLPFLYDQRLPVLLLGYRGDLGAPRPPDGRRHLGRAEWHDLDAAIHYAVRYGAERVVLYGWSTGATMALYAAQYSGLRDRIAGLVLDSPVLDWRWTLRALATARGLPGPLLSLAERAALGLLAPADGEAVDRVAMTSRQLDEAGGRTRLATPTLILHSPDDSVAGWEASETLADHNPTRATLYPVPKAAHAALWNVDPAAYEETLRRFLIPLM